MSPPTPPGRVWNALTEVAAWVQKADPYSGTGTHPDGGTTPPSSMTTDTQDFTFNGEATISRIVDGDTFEAEVQPWPNVVYEGMELRLSEIDTHETYGVSKDSEEYKQGKKEEDFVRSWISKAREYARKNDLDYPFIVEGESKEVRGRYKRWLVDVRRKGGGEKDVPDELNDALLQRFGDSVKYQPDSASDESSG